jgi:hypothetical protein
MNSIRGGGFMTSEVIRHHGDRRSDKLFFSGMAVIILASVFMGFAHTYYLAGVSKLHFPTCSFIFMAPCFPAGSFC